MLGKHREPGLQVQPGVALPFHDQKSYEKWHSRKEELARGGTRATATIQSISDVGTFDGRFVRVVEARIEPDGLAAFDTSTVVIEAAATSPLPVGGTVPAFFDPRDHTTVAFAVSSPGVINISGVGGLAQIFGQAQPTARWRVPSHCPDCGAPVDTAAACMAEDPMCDFCRRPLPVEPLA
jgi:hypothetical protein